jgi:hypothetical protein
MTKIKINKEGWVLEKDGVDEGVAEIMGDLQEVITNKIINQIKHVPEMQVYVGPFDQSGGGTWRPVLFALKLGGKSLDISIINRDLVNNPSKQKPKGFRVGKDSRKVWSLKGVVGHINEVWIPSRMKQVKQAANRQDSADEVSTALAGLSTKVYVEKQLTKLLYSIVRRWYTTGDGEVQYWIITDEKGREILERRAESRLWDLSGYSNHTKDELELIWVALKKNRNMCQIGHLYHETRKGYSNQTYFSHNTNKTNWFAPKNIMKYMDRLAGKSKGFERLMADPRNSQE